MAIELERATPGGRPAGPPGLLGRLLATAGPRWRWPPPPASAPRPPHERLPVGRAIVGEGAETQTGGGFSVGRGPSDLVPDEAMDDAVLRADPHAGGAEGPSGHCTVVFDPRVVSTLLSVISSALSGEAVVKGRSFFAGRIGETVAATARHPGRRPHRRPGLRRRRLTTARGWPAGATCSSPTACCACSSTTRSLPAGPGPLRPGRRCGAASPGRPGRAAGPWCSPRGPRATTRSWPRSARASTCSRSSGMHSGVNPVSGDFSVGAEGLHDRGRRAGRTGARGHRGLDAAAHAAVGRGDRRDLRWLPGVAAGQTLAIADMALSGD